MKIKSKIMLFISCLIAIIIITTSYLLKQSNYLPYEEMKSMTQDELISMFENITEKQLVQLACNYYNETFSTNVHTFDDFSVKFLEGKNGYQGESWYGSDIWLAGSVSSLEQAKEIALKFAKSDTYTDYSIDYIGENDLYYQLRVKRGPYVYRMNFFKDSIIKFSKGEKYRGGEMHYYFDDVIFQKIDYDTILTIMDLVYGVGKYRYLEEKDNEYLYVLYNVSTETVEMNTYGIAALKKHVIKISKETGKIEKNITTIKDNVFFHTCNSYR